MSSLRQSSDLPTRTAVVAGATGSVGGQWLALLDATPEYARVVGLTRRQSVRGNAAHRNDRRAIP
jgi:1-deoxy-D-xylulose 5-phosphate reductoisomerase